MCLAALLVFQEPVDCFAAHMAPLRISQALQDYIALLPAKLVT